jgi:hypothetical protein
MKPSISSTWRIAERATAFRIRSFYSHATATSLFSTWRHGKIWKRSIGTPRIQNFSHAIINVYITMENHHAING